MSRLSTMSAAALRAVFSPESDSDLILLLTIYDPLNPGTVLYRLCDGFTQRISETDDEVLYGTVSRGENYYFLPMNITLPQEEEASAPRCSITLNDVTQQLIPLIRTVSGPPTVLLEMVLSTSPSTVEASFSEFYIDNFTYNAETITAELSMIDYDREPFPTHSFTPSYFPGLF